MAPGTADPGAAGLVPARVGMVGAGYVAERCHLPAAGGLEEIEVVIVVDTDLARAAAVAERFGVPAWTDDARRIVGAVDGAIVGVPTALHARVAADLLVRGVPVLVEKPLALTVEEAVRLAEVSAGTGVPLQVGLMYRHAQSTRLVKRLIDAGRLGRLTRFEVEYGARPGWTGPGGWSREQAGGGVLMDIGPHMLDLLRWWLGAPVEVAYWDDRVDGIEAECRIALVLDGPGGVVAGDVTLSRLRRLGIRARLEGEAFTLEWRNVDLRFEVALQPTGVPETAADAFVADFRGGDTFRRMFAEQLRAFGQVVRGQGRPPVGADDGIAGLALIERCYALRRPLERPWA